MDFSLSNSLVGSAVSNPDKLALDLQFAADKTLTARKGPTPSFTRASSATFVGSNGLIQSAGNNVARFDHNPVTLACKGLLIEESRTNLVFPSETLATQTRTVTAVAHTLSFYGTGTVVLSGVAIATVTGTGSYPTRTTLTFTPTAGNLILTVTGSVTQAQLEAGAFATSYIPTVASTVVRSADVCSITGSAFAGFYNNNQGTIMTAASANGFTSTNNAIWGIESGTTIVARVFHRVAQTNRLSSQISAASLTPTVNYNSTNVVYKSALAADINGADYVIDGTQIPDSYAGSSLSADNLKFTGMSGSTSNTTISSFRYYEKRLPVAKLQTITV